MTRDQISANAIDLESEAVFSLSSEYVRAAFDDRVLLHHLGRGETLSLNLSAGIILDLMDGERSVAEIRELLGRAYPGAAEEIVRDVERTIRCLLESGAAVRGDRRVIKPEVSIAGLPAMEGEFRALARGLTEICRGRKVYYMPNPGNYGDALIRYATLRFFADVGLEVTEIRAAEEVPDPTPGGAVLIYGGGGAWCKLWRHGSNLLEPVANRFDRVVVLPSTFELPARLENATFFCRDRYESQTSMPQATFCHDMAFYLGSQDLGPPRSPEGFFFRTDEESGKRIRLPEENRDISATGDHYADPAKFFAAVAECAVVHTDRLHVAIAACLLGRELHFHPGSYFKNEAVFRSSLAPHFPRASFHPDASSPGIRPLVPASRERPVPRPPGRPLVSVVIPTYQRAHLVTQAIDSVLAQTFTDYEVIVVDDGSTDETREVLESYGTRIRAIHQRNQKLPAARNTGILAARGRYIAFLDDDDLWLPDKLQKQIPRIEARPGVGLLFSDTYYVGDDPDRVFRETHGTQVRVPEAPSFEELFLQNLVPVSTVIARRACFEQVGGFDESLASCEDYDMWLRIAHQWALDYVPEPLAKYRVAPGRMSENSEQMYLTLLAVKEKIYDTCPRARKISPDVVEQFYYNWYLTVADFYLDQDRPADARLIMDRYRERLGETSNRARMMARIEDKERALGLSPRTEATRPGPRLRGARETAFLILADDQPRQLARLVRCLSQDWARVFIHVDKKSDLAALERRLPRLAGVTLLPEESRIRTARGGYSTVEATLELLRAAIASGEEFDRFCLLSGSHLPIRPMAEARGRFAGGVEFIRVDRCLGDPDDPGHFENVRYFHFNDLPEKAHLNGKIAREPYEKIALYQGTQWWALTSACIRWILRFVEQNPDYAEFHKWTLAPEEIFFHSIVKHSPFAARISHDFETAPSLAEHLASPEHGATYVDWSGGSAEKVLEAGDLDKLMRSDCLFAGRFDEKASSTLVERLTDQLAGSNGSCSADLADRLAAP